MSNGWYEVVAASTPLTQGDLIKGCPLAEWDEAAIANGTALEAALKGMEGDVIVMTQACDLEQGKVQNVLLCPADPLSTYKDGWDANERANGQNPTTGGWKKHCNRIASGFVWNLAILDRLPDGEHVIVDFHEVYTAPRAFLDSFLRTQNQPRYRLRSPYREHLSQAFARFFMRVGLPTSVTVAW